MLKIASLLIALALRSQAAVFDVGPNPGQFPNISAAFVSITASLGSIPASETITVMVHGGSYSSSGSIPAMAQPLQIIGEPGTQATLSSAAAFGIQATGIAHIRVQGMRIQGYSQAGISLINCPNAVVIGNTLNNNATEIRLENCPGSTVHGNQLRPSSSGILALDSQGSMFSYNQASAWTGGSYSSALTLTNSAGSQVLNNVLSEGRNGITLIGSSGVTVSANALVARTGSPVQGIGIDTSSNCLVMNNLAVGQLTGIGMLASSGNAIVNNSIWEHNFAGLSIKNCSGITLRNNIVGGKIGIDTDAASQGSLSSQNNNLVGANWLAVGITSYANLAAWQGTGNDTVSSISSDPLFVNPTGSSAQDFVLQGGSPVQNLGQDLSSSFSGDYFGSLRPVGPWDFGFYELGGGTPTPTPSFTASPIVPTLTPTPTPLNTATFTVTPSPVYSPSASPTPSITSSITPTYTPTQYPFRKDRLISYPNPYNPSSGMPLNLVYEPSDEVSLRIMDISGALIIEIPSSNIQSVLGYASWNARNESGSLVPAGLYLAILRSSRGNRFTRFTVVH